MAGVFNLKKGAFDSSEAADLHQAYVIALQGLRATHAVDHAAASRLARSIVKVVRAEPDCLRNDGTIDPVRLAQRAILRMLQLNAPGAGAEVVTPMPRQWVKASPAPDATTAPASPTSIIRKIFDRTSFAKL